MFEIEHGFVTMFLARGQLTMGELFAKRAAFNQVVECFQDNVLVSDFYSQGCILFADKYSL